MVVELAAWGTAVSWTLESGRRLTWLHSEETELSSVGMWSSLGEPCGYLGTPQTISQRTPICPLLFKPHKAGGPWLPRPCSPALASPVSSCHAHGVTKAEGQMQGPLKAKSLPPRSHLCFLRGSASSFSLSPRFTSPFRLFIQTSTHPSIHSFMQPTFIEHLLCSCHLTVVNKNKAPALAELTV